MLKNLCLQTKKEVYNEGGNGGKNMKKLLIPLLLAPLTFVGISCKKKEQPKEAILSNYSIHRDGEFGGAFIDISIQDFNNLGFKFGDSLKLSFSNGVNYEDIGYYSGYYVPAGKELVVGYPGYDYIKFCINYGADVYTENNFNSDTKVTITVDESQKYKDVEETLNITYSDKRSDYTTDEEFANFREVTVGDIKPGKLYRGASPIDNRRNRAAIVDSLLQKNGIAYDIDLADKRSTIEGFDAPSEYFRNLDKNNKVVLLGMGAAYTSDEFTQKMKTMFEAILANNGPYYVHCLEGKDRTGYVCMVLEAMCGATYDELVDDYFVTYMNYYKIEKNSTKYNVIKEMHIDEMIRYVFNFPAQTNLLTANYYSQADNYLKAVGLTSEQISQIRNKLIAE